MAARKLKSRRGASVIIALLVLLICVTAGAAALTAASANAGRYTHMRRDQQRYLAVSSAVKLVRDELAAGRMEASVQAEETTAPDTMELTYNMGAVSVSYTGAFADWLKGDLEACFKDREIPGEWWDPEGALPAAFDGAEHTGLAMKVTTADAEPLLSKVKWTLSMADDYTITARFWLADDEGQTYYPTVLTLPATRDETTESGWYTQGAGQRWQITKTVNVTWSAADATITQG